MGLIIFHGVPYNLYRSTSSFWSALLLVCDTPSSRDRPLCRCHANCASLCGAGAGTIGVGRDWPHVTEKHKPDEAVLFDLLAVWGDSSRTRDLTWLIILQSSMVFEERRDTKPVAVEAECPMGQSGPWEGSVLAAAQSGH